MKVSPWWPRRRRGVQAAVASLGLFGVACGLFFPYDLEVRRRFYPVFPDYYLEAVGPRNPGGSLRYEDRLRGDQHPLLPDGGRAAQRGLLRERGWPT